MIKYFLLFLLSFLLIGCSSETRSTELVIPVKNDFFVFEVPNGIEAFFDKDAVKSISEYYKEGTIVINGSYFGGTQPGQYYPAGYWEINKKILHIPELAKTTYPIFDDSNITHFVGFSGTEMNIFPNIKFKENAGPYDFSFQSGPLVLSGGVLQDFGQSWHANGKHERTLIGKTKNGKIFIFVSTSPISLSEIGQKILTDQRFILDPITVLNLDGGPSTAFFDGKNEFRSNKKFPIIFRLY